MTRGAILFFLMGAAGLWAQAPDKAPILAALRQAIERKQPAPVAGEAQVIAPVPAPAELNPTLGELEALAVKTGDPELIDGLLAYQLAFLAPENDFPSRALGRLYYELGDSFLQQYRKLEPVRQIQLRPYLEFGWEKAVQGKNKSLPKIVERQKKLDALFASLMNVGKPD
jgi:hypothetical protein